MRDTKVAPEGKVFTNGYIYPKIVILGEDSDWSEWRLIDESEKPQEEMIFDEVI